MGSLESTRVRFKAKYSRFATNVARQRVIKGNQKCTVTTSWVKNRQRACFSGGKMLNDGLSQEPSELWWRVMNALALDSVGAQRLGAVHADGIP
jgi:hypothetical protein